MSIRDISGVFSRFFITGFFLPAFFTLFVLWITVSSELQPDEFERESKGTQVLVLGGFALLVALILLGLRHPFIRFFEGYPFQFRPLIWLQRWSRRRMARRKPGTVGTRWRLDRLFPQEENRLLPTRVGNAIRAAEDHAYIRYGLDHIAVWPRVDSLLNEREQELHSNARSDLHFFLNSAIGSVVVGVVLIIDQGLDPRLHEWSTLVYALPFVTAWGIYRMAVGAAEAWGLEMRVSVDMHRFELYDKLGVRRPPTPTEEKTTIAPAVNRFLLTGDELPELVWSATAGRTNPGKEA